MKALEWARCAGLVLVVGCCTQARAELPPGAYPNPARASESVDVKILSVSIRVTENNSGRVCYDVELKAEVREVRKTSTNLKVGETITIKYDGIHYKNPGVTGRGSHPVPKKGASCSVALRAMGEEGSRCYEPYGAPYNAWRPPAKKNSSKD